MAGKFFVALFVSVLFSSCFPSAHGPNEFFEPYSDSCTSDGTVVECTQVYRTRSVDCKRISSMDLPSRRDGTRTIVRTVCPLRQSEKR